MSHSQVVRNSDKLVGDMGQAYLAMGKNVALRRWKETATTDSHLSTRSYETVGYLIEGVMELDIDGETVKLRAGDSWHVPKGVEHQYRIIEAIVAIEATSPPGRVNHRDDQPT